MWLTEKLSFAMVATHFMPSFLGISSLYFVIAASSGQTMKQRFWPYALFCSSVKDMVFSPEIEMLPILCWKALLEKLEYDNKLQMVKDYFRRE